MIQKLQQTFHSIIKSLEVLYVIEDIKSCARILVFEDRLGKALSCLKENGLQTEISGFKVIKHRTQSEFYSDKSVKTPKESVEKGSFFVYISKDKQLAEKAKLLEEQNNHFGLGQILGYPDCCCSFFQNHFNDEKTDLTLEILENSSGYDFPFYCNIAARHFDISLLSHFPHSFECSPSMEIGKKNLKAVRKHSKELSDIFSGILRSVVVYTEDEGIFLLRKFEKSNGEILYGDVITTTKSKLYFLLASNKRLRIIDKNSFLVNDVKIEEKDYGIMVFG